MSRANKPTHSTMHCTNRIASPRWQTDRMTRGMEPTAVHKSEWYTTVRVAKLPLQPRTC